MRKSKKLISAVLTPVAFVPLASVTLVGCSDKYTKIVDKLNADFEEEFKHVCSVGRPTFENREFCNYMIAHIQQLGIKPESIVTDADTYKPKGHPKHGFNFYYDIPATKGLENSDGIILQCHTDMVWKKASPDLEITHPIVVKEQDKQGNWIMHSKGYQTSLGADDGAGIAACLAITRNANEFEHGPIRVLMTTDEEDGPSGASYIDDESWWKSNSANYQIKYLLNLDLEETNKICQSTAGVQQAKWEYEAPVIYETISPESKNQNDDEEHIWNRGVTLQINGLSGGHSAKVIKEGKLNAIKLAADILNDMNEYYKKQQQPVTCQIFRAFENDSPSDDTTPGTVPNRIEISFATNYGNTFEDLRKTIIDEIVPSYKCEADNQFEVVVDPYDFTNNPGPEPSIEMSVITNDASLKIIDFIRKLPYKVSDWLDNEETLPATSWNVGAFRIRDEKYAPAKEDRKKPITVYIETFGRSCLTKKLGKKPSQNQPLEWEGFMREFKRMSLEVFGNDLDQNTGNWNCEVGWNPCWKTKEDDKLPKLLMQAAEHYGTKAEYLDEHSWLEIGEFALKSQNELDISAIGPTIDHVHNIMETLYLDTVSTMFKNLVYVLDNIIQRKES